jgi:hypothetical protein
MGVSMNKLAQDAIAAQLGMTAVFLEARLEKTLHALRQYRGTWSDDEIAAFAHSDVEHEDPAQGHMIEMSASIEADESDPFGVARAFAGSRNRAVATSLE